MSPETELRPPGSRSLPELDVEQDVDLRKYWNRLSARWWLPALGLVAGALLGYALSFGGGKTYEAKALVYLGNPLSTGGTSITSIAANPRFVSSTVRSEDAIREAARAAGLRPSDLRGRISSAPVSGGTVLGSAGAKGPQTLVNITLTGHRSLKTATAANALAAYVVRHVSRFPSVKIRVFKVLLESNARELTTVSRRISALNRTLHSPRLDPFQQLVLVSEVANDEQRRGSLLTQQAVTQQQLTQAREVELPRIASRAFSVETTARSARNSALVGGVIGLLLGALAALVLDRFPPLRRRSA